ncbi:MAG: serine hydrolase [Luteitalea sp.]|nr:serine hydrolase [Luteitalea sp.]
MPHRMRRREFLVGGSRAALSVSLLPLVACSQDDQRSAELEQSAPWEILIADLETQIPQLMEEAIVPGLSIAVIKDGTLLWRRGFGIKDSESNEPVDSGTIFEAGSVSKPVFAYAVMKLCEKGVIGLDTPLTEYISERFLVDTVVPEGKGLVEVEGDPRLKLITARHVLSHSSGFQNWRSEKEPLKIHFTPGEEYLYSGEGYSYLQSVVTHLTGQPIEPYMTENLFVPFGMTSSSYVWNDTFEKHAARPHDPEGEPLAKRKGTATAAARYASAGGLRGTPTDLAKLIIEVIDPKESDAFRLKKDSLEEMLRPQVKVPQEESDPYSSSWALGWQIIHAETGNVITHGGYNEGFVTRVVASVEGKYGYVIMTNGDNGGEVLQKLILGDTTLNRLVAAG